MIYNWRMVYTGLFGVWIVYSLTYGWFIALNLKPYKLFIVQNPSINGGFRGIPPCSETSIWGMGENLWIYHVTEGITSHDLARFWPITITISGADLLKVPIPYIRPKVWGYIRGYAPNFSVFIWYGTSIWGSWNPNWLFLDPKKIRLT